MDCYTNNRDQNCRRPQMITPAPCKDCSCGLPPVSIQPMPRPAVMPDAFLQSRDRYPVGMAYVPCQTWQQTYALDIALHQGTIFPDLDQPFRMGRC